VTINDDDFILSQEHMIFSWCMYEEAYYLFSFDSNKVALYEFNVRLNKETLETI